MNERDYIAINVLLAICLVTVVFFAGYTLGCIRTANEFYRQLEEQQRIIPSDEIWQGVHVA